MNAKPTCPECGSKHVVRIAYGYPGPEMMRDAERGRIVLGGCVIAADSPKWSCSDCRATWGGLFDDEDA
jgi:transposase-like protein